MGVSLREVFTPLFTYVLLFARTPAQQRRSFTELRGDIQRLLDEQKVLVKRHDLSAVEYDAARFAAVAWTDELLLWATHDSNRELSTQWKRSPLQVEMYNTANAGEEFFDRLARLGPAQKAIREIYHLCLCLGFRGRYYDETQDYKLVALRREAAQQLPAPVADLLELDKRQERITPAPYAVQAPAPQRPPRSYAAAVAGLLMAVAAAIVVYVLWPAPHRSRADILADVMQRTRPFTCCHLTADFQERTGLVTLVGRAESNEQRQQIRQAIRGVPEVTDVQESLTLIPHPFCDVVELLDPLQARSKESGVDLTVRPQKGCNMTYYRNENLVVSVAAHKPLQYVYVDYYVADKQVVAHLLPNTKQHDNMLKTATSVTLGGSDSDTQWQVQPPFGTELMTVVTSPQPLFAQPRSQPGEPVAAYLDDLRKILPSDGASTEVSGAYCFISTEDR